MDKSDRERRHQASLEQIQHVQLVVGRGDRLRIDHEGTLLERARMTSAELSSHEATERGLAAFDRLLLLAERGNSPHVRDIVAFVAAVWSNKPLPLATLRCVEEAIGDDMLAVLDAFRHARLNLAEHVEGGPRRVARIVDKRSLAGV
jgi:hypothetical protein